MKTYKTPKGKEIEVYYLGRNLAVRFKGGGELPQELSGTWTNEIALEHSLQMYLASKEKDNAKAGQSTE